jgi:hypothetical protein
MIAEAIVHAVQVLQIFKEQRNLGALLLVSVPTVRTPVWTGRDPTPSDPQDLF